MDVNLKSVQEIRLLKSEMDDFFRIREGCILQKRFKQISNFIESILFISRSCSIDNVFLYNNKIKSSEENYAHQYHIKTTE